MLQRGEPQRQIPSEGNPHQVLAPSGENLRFRFANTSRLRRETRLQRWIHRNALAPLPQRCFTPALAPYGFDLFCPYTLTPLPPYTLTPLIDDSPLPQDPLDSSTRKVQKVDVSKGCQANNQGSN